jgi:hypothetical protein
MHPAISHICRHSNSLTDAEEAEAPSDDDAFDDRQQQSVASAHAQWIPTLAKVACCFWVCSSCVLVACELHVASNSE